MINVNHIKIVAAFVIGVATGLLATRTYYKNLYDEEVKSVKEAFNRENNVKKKKESKPSTEEVKEETKPQAAIDAINDILDDANVDVITYASRLGKNTAAHPEKNVGTSYEQYNRPYVHRKPDVATPPVKEGVYSVPYEVFSNRDYDEYDERTFYFYADDVWGDEEDHEVENIERILGLSPEEHFGEYDDDEDVGYFINHDREVKFEILRSAKFYHGDVIIEDDDDD